VTLGRRPAWDHDCRSATGRDFHWAMAGTERRVSLQCLDGPEKRPARPLQVALRMAGRTERQVAAQQTRMAEPQAQPVESVLAQAHWGQARQASLQPAQLEPERAPSVQLALPPELQPQALLARPASQSVSQVQLALRQQAQRWLAEARQVRPQASSARPSPQHPLRPSPLWRWLPQQLQLRLVPGDSCEPFRPLPRGWSSSASFFPLRRTPVKGQ
jgi:hypothetical protein